MGQDSRKRDVQSENTENSNLTQLVAANLRVKKKNGNFKQKKRE